MWIDCEKVMKKYGEGSILKAYFELEGEDGCLTDCEQKIETTPYRIKTVVKVASEHNHTWIDKNFISEFGIKKGLHFTVSDNKYKPVLVWEEDVLCGLMLPVRVKEDE